jgi:hypothetical protein
MRLAGYLYVLASINTAVSELGFSCPAATWFYRCSACKSFRGNLLVNRLAGTACVGERPRTVLFACYMCSVPMGVGAFWGLPEMAVRTSVLLAICHSACSALAPGRGSIASCIFVYMACLHLRRAEAVSPVLLAAPHLIPCGMQTGVVTPCGCHFKSDW